jgi:ketosteroid isomerase-like protein
MDRRTFVGLAAGMAALPAGIHAAKPDEDVAIRQRIADLYSAFSMGDISAYRSFLADDYLLLENGEVSDADQDIAFMRDRPEGFHRSDSFDFRRVGVSGDMAYAVYFVNSLASDPQTPPKSLRWLESIAFRKTKGEWLCVLIHSTVIAPPQIEEIGSDKG